MYSCKNLHVHKYLRVHVHARTCFANILHSRLTTGSGPNVKPIQWFTKTHTSFSHLRLRVWPEIRNVVVFTTHKAEVVPTLLTGACDRIPITTTIADVIRQMKTDPEVIFNSRRPSYKTKIQHK